MSSFHAKDGWYFTREDDGSVRIEHATSHQQFSVALDADTWASAVASVCADGEDANTFGKALILHNEPKHLARISVTHGPDPMPSGPLPDLCDLLAEWHRRNDGRKMPFAEDEDKRCEAVRVPGRDIFDQPDKTIYRCGRAKGHDGRHACSDEGGVTLKWFTEGADSQ